MASTLRLHEQIVAFCRYLRGVGVTTDPSQLIVFGHATAHIDIGSEADFRNAARAVLVNRREWLPLFDTAFNEFWRQERNTLQDRSTENADLPRSEKFDDKCSDSNPTVTAHAAMTEHILASSTEWLSKKDLATVSEHELHLMQVLCAELARRITTRVRRRYRKSRCGTVLDYRTQIRQASKGRELDPPLYRLQRRRPRQLFILCDVSGSMERYSRFFIQLIAALGRELPQVSLWFFSTRLTGFDRQSNARQVNLLLQQIARQVDHWNSGTRLGECLQAFIDSEEFQAHKAHSEIMVLSDGWETGTTGTLLSAMQKLHQQSLRIFWLNPLKGHDNYEPLCAGMAVALPYIDYFLPAQNLVSLSKGLELALLAGSEYRKCQGC